VASTKFTVVGQAAGEDAVSDFGDVADDSSSDDFLSSLDEAFSKILVVA
jgi:hypothetical protein